MNRKVGKLHCIRPPLPVRCGGVLRSTLVVAMALCALMSAGPVVAQNHDVSNQAARSAYVYDLSARTFLLQEAADAPFDPGALAKVMTAAVVLEALQTGEIARDATFQVSENAWRRGGAPARRTTMFAELGSHVPITALLTGLAVHDANDAAIVLAEGLAGSEAAFVERMNALAAKVGMTGSRFANPIGFPEPANVTTARDLGLLARHMLGAHDSDALTFFTQPDFTWNDIFQRSKNPLLGVATGLAGVSMAGASDDGFAALATVAREDRLVVFALGPRRTQDARRRAVEALIDEAFARFRLQPIFAPGEVIAFARVHDGAAGRVALIAPHGIDALLPPGETSAYRLRAVYHGPLRAPVSAGETVGELRVMRDDTIVFAAPLETRDAVETGGVWMRARDGLASLLWGWL